MADILKISKSVKLLVKMKNVPWPVWFSGLSAVLQSQMSQVRFPVMAHARVGDQVPSGGCVRDNWSMYLSHISDVSVAYWCFSPSLSPFLPFSLKRNKILRIIKKRKYMCSIYWNKNLLFNGQLHIPKRKPWSLCPPTRKLFFSWSFLLRKWY